MTHRRTNLALLVLVPIAVLTGLVANTAGTTWGVHPSIMHGIAALAVLLLAPWKQVVIRRSWNKRRRFPWISLGLLLLIVTTIATGLMHAFGYQRRIGPLTLMQVHVGGAVMALLLLWRHYRLHPVRARRQLDLNRRTFLRSLGLVAGGAAVWAGLEGVFDVFHLAGGRRRFTGSHERGSFDPDGFPVTSWLDDQTPNLDSASWRVMVDGNALTMSDLGQLPRDSLDAVLDCTSAWFTEQTWTGVRLDRLLEPTGRSIEVISATGYSRRYPARDLRHLWLVTEVGGSPLSPGHGYPARIVAPGRRGFWWVKWVVEIRGSDLPWWLQLPFPAT